MLGEDYIVQRRKMSLTPLIDIVFILLLFFMVATSFSQHRDMSISLAGESADPQPENRSFVLVAILDDATASVNGENFGYADITQAINGAAAEREETIVLVRVAGEANVQALISVMEAARRAQVQAVAMVDQ
jgi:biopolymer transport protein ExbD